MPRRRRKRLGRTSRPPGVRSEKRSASCAHLRFTFERAQTAAERSARLRAAKKSGCEWSRSMPLGRLGRLGRLGSPSARDFDAVAAVLRQSVQDPDDQPFVDNIASDLADHFERVNPRFKRRKFLDAVKGK